MWAPLLAAPGLESQVPLSRRRAPPVSLFPVRTCLLCFLSAGSKALEINFRSDDIAHLFLQFVHGKRSVQHDEIVGVNHFVVLLEDARLEQAKALCAVVRHSQVHARLVVFQFGATAQDAIHRDVQRRAEVKGDVRNGCEAVESSQPARRTTCGKERTKAASRESVTDYATLTMKTERKNSSIEYE